MNSNLLISMLRDDPTLTNDIPAFVARMNVKNINQVVRKHTEVVDEMRVTSIAEMNGGRCTAREIQEAVRFIAAESLLIGTSDKYEKVKQAILAGEVTTLAEAGTKFSAS